MYKTEPFEKVLRELFGPTNALFGASQSELGCLAKVAVVSTESAAGKLQPVVLSNYNRPHKDRLAKRMFPSSISGSLRFSAFC